TLGIWRRRLPTPGKALPAFQGGNPPPHPVGIDLVATLDQQVKGRALVLQTQMRPPLVAVGGPPALLGLVAVAGGEGDPQVAARRRHGDLPGAVADGIGGIAWPVAHDRREVIAPDGFAGIVGQPHRARPLAVARQERRRLVCARQDRGQAPRAAAGAAEMEKRSHDDVLVGPGGANETAAEGFAPPAEWSRLTPPSASPFRSGGAGSPVPRSRSTPRWSAP